MDLKPEELNHEEKQTFEGWKKILSEGEITVEKIAQFCDFQIKSIEYKFKDLDRTPIVTERLVLLHSVYAAIRDLIKNPKAEKEALEKHLQSLL